MSKVKIAPPPPPKLSKEEKTKKSKEDKKEKKVDLAKDSTSEKKGFFGKLFAKKDKTPELEIPKYESPKEDVSDDDFDLDKIRAGFGIAEKEEEREISEAIDEEEISPPKNVTKKEETPKKKKSEPKESNTVAELMKDADLLKKEVSEIVKDGEQFDKSEKPINWADGDIVSEYHDSKEQGDKWDEEEPEHIHKTKKEKVKPKKKASDDSHLLVDVEAKIPVVKPKIKVREPIAQELQRRSKVDSAVDEYFKRVEAEQKLIQKEIQNIVVHPKRALEKKSVDYFIHHNEKLFKSMKELLAALKSIDEEEFNQKVRIDKESFYKWVQGILDKEKEAEKERNKILKQQMKQVLKEYSQGISKDVEDKKYELKVLNRDADRRLTDVQKQEARLKAKTQELKEKEKEINDVIENGIKKQLDIRLKNERRATSLAEKEAKKLIDTYTAKSNKFKEELAAFVIERKQAKEELEKGAVLKRLDVSLQKRKARLDALSEQFKKTGKEQHAREKDLVEREEKAADILQREKDLIIAEKELKLKFREYTKNKEEYDVREKEVTSMETYVNRERVDLKDLKESLRLRESEAASKLKEVKEIEEGLTELEQKKILSPVPSDDLDFSEYESTKPVVKESGNKEIEDFYTHIDKCRSMIDHNHLNDAKKLYNEIKIRFGRTNFIPAEKEELYNAIRELYDDIYLAVLAHN